jgi:hypothetical protein
MSRPRTADARRRAVADIAACLDLREGASLARRLAASVGGEAAERHGRYPVAVGALRSVRRRLDFAVPAVGSAAASLGVDPEAVVAAERLLEAELSPPGDPADVARLSAAIGTYRALLDVLDVDGPVEPRPTADGDRTAVPDVPESAASPAAGRDDSDDVPDARTLRAHLARLEADRAMAQLGFALYDIVCPDGDAERE